MERAFSLMMYMVGAQKTTVPKGLFELPVVLRYNGGTRRGTRKDAADVGASGGSAAEGERRASSALEIDNIAGSSCSEGSSSDEDESGTDDRYAGYKYSAGRGRGVNGQHQP